jgi:hypothetical protein
MIASEWNALQSPNNKVLGHNGVLNRDDEIGLPSPSAIGDMAAWYDLSETTSLFRDGSDRLQLMGDVSGNSGAGKAGDRFLYLDGQSGTYASSPDSANYPTGDAEFEWCGTLASYSSASATTVLNAKRGDASSDISWSFLLRTDGTISLTHSSNGTSVPSSATVKSNAITLTDGLKAYFKATLDVDNGASGHTIAYYESSDGVTWVSLGSVVVAGVTSIFNSTTPFTVGAQFTAGNNGRLTGKTFYSLVRDGIDGTTVINADFTSQNLGSAPFTESSFNAATVTLNGTAMISYVDEGNALVLTGAAGNNAVTTSAAQLLLTGDMQIDVDCELAEWTAPVANYDLISKLEAGTFTGYSLSVIATTGVLRLSIGNGVTIKTYNSSVAPTVANLGRLRLRVVYDADDGASGSSATFSTSTDGVTYSALGTPATDTDQVVATSATALYLGAYAGNTSLSIVNGNIYRATLRNEAGTVVYDADFSTVAKLATSFTESSSNAATVTINSTAIDLPARIHGARDLYMGTAAFQPTYLGWSGTNYGHLPALGGSYFASDANVDLTGDIDLVSFIRYDSSTGAYAELIGDAAGLSGEATLRMYTGALGLRWYVGATITEVVSSAHSVAAGTDIYFRAKRVNDDGGIYKVYFYKSTDGSSWTLISSHNGAGVAAPTSVTNVIRVGESGLTGFVYKAEAWQGDSTAGGTLVADLNPADYTSGSTFVSSATGETWTIVNRAHIVTRTGAFFDGDSHYIKSAPFSLSQPENVYLVGEQMRWSFNRSIFEGDIAAAMKLAQSGSSPDIVLGNNTSPLVSDWLTKTCAAVCALFNSASSELRVNRNAAAVSDIGTNDGNGFTLGARPNGRRQSNIFASEILIYDTVAHDTTTQDRLALYAGRKWIFPV